MATRLVTTLKDPYLRRFWFPVPGHLGIGISAHTRLEANAIATGCAKKQGWTLDVGACIEDIDLQLLDPKHVLPNVGPVVFHGIWYPPLNL